jgi:hypothetical protein
LKYHCIAKRETLQVFFFAKFSQKAKKKLDNKKILPYIILMMKLVEKKKPRPQRRKKEETLSRLSPPAPLPSRIESLRTLHCSPNGCAFLLSILASMR